MSFKSDSGFDPDEVMEAQRSVPREPDVSNPPMEPTVTCRTHPARVISTELD
jgi:hypothetical protein